MTTTLTIVIPDDRLRGDINNKLAEKFIISVSKSVDDCTACANDNNVDLILCHQSLLTQSVLSQIKDVYPNARILIIGPQCPSNVQVELLKMGARGFFDESLSMDKLANALQCIFMGEVWVERHIISGLIDEFSQAPQVSEQQRQMLESLSPKEHEVAQLVSHGATNKMIAKKMAITERTVKAHLTAIFQKLSLHDRLSLAIFFRDLR